MHDPAAPVFGLVLFVLVVCSMIVMAVVWHRWTSLAALERQHSSSKRAAGDRAVHADSAQVGRLAAWARSSRPGAVRSVPAAAVGEGEPTVRLLAGLDRAWRASPSGVERTGRRGDDAIVYVELERALRRCERLSHALDERPDVLAALSHVHRALEFAAFITSEHLEVAERLALRTEARQRHVRGADADADTLLGDLTLLVDTAGVITRQTRDPVICEELHLAAGQIGQARQALRGLCAGTDRRHAGRARGRS